MSRIKDSLTEKERDFLAKGLNDILGIKVVREEYLEEVKKHSQQLEEKLSQSQNNHSDLLPKYFGAMVKLYAFKNYHSQWKPLTREINKRSKRLMKEKLMIDFEELEKTNKSISENLNEAYNCYLNGQNIASYVMILRTVELIVNQLYDLEANKTNKHIPTGVKLEWCKKNRIIGGTDFYIMKGLIDGRNEVIHNVYVPDELNILSGLKTIIPLLDRLK